MSIAQLPPTGAPARGSRQTVQRALVLEAVRSLHQHPTSNEVYEAVREKYPYISRATVYRNLAVLSARGEIGRVQVPTGADRYDFHTAHHYHARCKTCGNVFDIDMPPLPDLMESITDGHGFKIEAFELLFEGVCPACLAGEEKQKNVS